MPLKQGVPSKCHPDKWEMAIGLCQNCYAKHLRDTRPDYKERQKKKNREYHARLRKENPDKYSANQRNRILKHRYGITQEEYESRLMSQGFACAICRKPESEIPKRMYVDHDHTSGKARGILCPGCNTAVGVVEKGTDFIASLYEYIKKHEE